MKSVLKLIGWGGQSCDVVITVQDDQNIFVDFRSEPGYGYPSLDLKQLEMLVAIMKQQASL